MGWGVGERGGWVEGGEGEGVAEGAEWMKGDGGGRGGEGGGDRDKCLPHPYYS